MPTAIDVEIDTVRSARSPKREALPPERALRVLLVEDSPAMSSAVAELLNGHRRYRFETIQTHTLKEALAALSGREPFDVILLDLGLPDAQRLEGPISIRGVAPDLPIVVLTGEDDDALIEESASAGVQDYLLKQDLTTSLLIRTVRYAIERNRLQHELRSQALRDELTGLYNRRGFFTLAEQQLKVASRLGKSVVVFYIDVDEMKTCNDERGHQAGDHLLHRVGHLLRRTFRESDVLARVGGDEFAILAIDTTREIVANQLDRLERSLVRENQEADETCRIQLSVGYASAPPGETRTLDELLRNADDMMYRRKKSSG